MPSFVCDHCQETLKKAKLDQHAQRCRNAVFSCIDCYKTFKGTDYRGHTSCITEVQKYHDKGSAKPSSQATTTGSTSTGTKTSSSNGQARPTASPLETLKASLAAGKPVSLKVLKKQLKAAHGKSGKGLLSSSKVSVSVDAKGQYRLHL